MKMVTFLMLGEMALHGLLQTFKDSSDPFPDLYDEQEELESNEILVDEDWATLFRPCTSYHLVCATICGA